MYSWAEYQLAMNKINKSLLPKNSRSNKAWVRFPINEIPLSNNRLAQLLNEIESNGWGRKRFLPTGYLWNDTRVSYDYYLNSLGTSVKNTKKKWKSHATEIGSVYVLANKWILATPKSFPTDDIMIYWFNKNNKIQKFNIGYIINEFYNSQSFDSQEEQFWEGGLNPNTYNQGYSLAPHGKGNDKNYFWHPEKEGFVNMRDIKALAEAFYNRGEKVKQFQEEEFNVDTKEAVRQIWGVKWVTGRNTDDEKYRLDFDGNYKKEAESIHESYLSALPVIEPPRTQWIINYTHQITSLLKT